MDVYRDRFFKRIKKTSYCWIWIGFKMSSIRDYGGFLFKGKTIGAHRASWIIHKGEIPKGFHVLHNCDNPICVNPSHLFIGTHKDNMERRAKKGYLKGEGSPRCILTEKQVLEIRSKWIPKKYTKEHLAKEYGVSVHNIVDIIRRRTWTHI